MPPEWIAEKRAQRKKALLISFGAMAASLAILLGLLQILALDVEKDSWTKMELVRPRRGHARVETDVRAFAQFGWWIRHHKILSWGFVIGVCAAMYGVQSLFRRRKAARKYLHVAHVVIVVVAAAVFAMIVIQTTEIQHGIQ